MIIPAIPKIPTTFYKNPQNLFFKQNFSLGGGKIISRLLKLKGEKMKKLALALLLVVCGVSADDYEEFLEYKKWQEQKAKSQSKKDTAKSPKDASKDVKDTKSSDSTNSQKSTKTAESNAKSSQDSIKDMQTLDSKAISKLKSGGFIGVNLGGGLGANASVDCVGSCIFDGKSRSSGIADSVFSLWYFDAGILGGYTHFFIPYVGLRGYGEFDYGIAIGERKDDTVGDGIDDKVIKYKGNYYLISLGMDLLAEYAFGQDRHFSVGGVLGIGGGYIIHKGDIFNDFSKFGFIVNAGISFGFLHKHRIELLAKLTPFADFMGYNKNDFKPNDSGIFSEEHSQVKWLGLLSYKYTF